MDSSNPGLQDSSDPELVPFEPKQTPGPEFYNRCSLARRVGLMGVGFAALFGVGCICVGLVILRLRNPSAPGVMVVYPRGQRWKKEVFSLMLNLMVTGCTEATGFAHGIALRSALASEHRLHFNTNLRLLSAASGVFNPNGTLCNTVMTILLIVSYTSSLLAILSFKRSRFFIHPNPPMSVSGVPFVVLGIALLLQAVIALASVWYTKILTWSSSPFDITAALVHHAQIVSEPGRCMHGVVDDKRQGPVKPSRKQPSAWRARKGARNVAVALWLPVAIYVVWGSSNMIYVYLSEFDPAWSFFPRLGHSPFLHYRIRISGWVLCYLNMVAIQGPMTLLLHCSELIVNVVRDERAWRKATTTKGTTISLHPLASVFGSPLNVALLVSKPLLHWMLGVGITFDEMDISSMTMQVHMWSIQIFNYSAALLILSLILIVFVLLRPSGPQPAAYGHIQTLANLIDEWSPTMWWGHKSAGHAGTSDVRLSEVDRNALYG